MHHYTLNLNICQNKLIV